jgi:tetratricopeptide (TPR) repeat protein
MSQPRKRLSLVRRGALLILAGTVATAALSADPRLEIPLTRERALEALARPDAAERLAGVHGLGEVGVMGDVEALLPRLRDPDPLVRLHAADSMWRIWSRSGNAAIDELFRRGVAQMKEGNFGDAAATFDEIIRREPAFAEGWNKRATIRFLVGDYENSLRDCEEVFKRNPYHFGAMAGAAQIHLVLGHPELALAFFRRALDVNPNLVGPARMKDMLERHLREEEAERRRHTT